MHWDDIPCTIYFIYISNVDPFQVFLSQTSSVELNSTSENMTMHLLSCG